jgi:predicted transcriptional regulator of viral defense system
MRSGKEHAHVDVSERSGMSLYVTSLERTLVDVLDRPGLCGSWEEIWRSLASVEYFDLEKVVDYAVMLQNSTTAAKVGFFLDQHREQLMVEDKYLSALIKMRPRQPHYLERTRRESGRLISKWNLVIPDQILKQTWEEII